MNRSSTDLQYGHSGSIKYVDSRQSWLSNTDAGSAIRTFQTLSGPNLHLSRSREHEPFTRRSQRDYANDARFWKELISSDPQTTAAEKPLKNIAKQLDQNSNYHAANGRGIANAFDTALITESGRETPALRRIFVFPHGSAGDRLALAVGIPHRQGWKDDHDSWLQSSSPNSSSVSFWSPGIGHIRQLAFQYRANQGEADPLLLVLFENALAILKPVFRERGNPVPDWQPSLILPVGLDRRDFPLCVFHLDDEVVHAAVHPVNQHFIAFVLYSGAPRAWRVDHSRGSKSPTEIFALSEGLQQQHKAPKGAQSPWYRIFWLETGLRFAVLSAARITIYDIEDGKISLKQSQKVKDSSTLVTIHAACQHPLKPSILALASATCVHVIDLDGCNDLIQEPDARQILRWKHFHDLRDTEVRIQFVRDNYDALVLTVPEMCLFLHFDVSLSRDNSDKYPQVLLGASKSDFGPDMLKPSSRTICIPCEITISEKTDDSEQQPKAMRYRQAGLKFYSAFSLEISGNVRSCIYTSGPTEALERVEPLVWTSSQKRRKVRGDQIIYDRFVVEDEDAEQNLVPSLDFGLASTALDTFKEAGFSSLKEGEFRESRKSDYNRLYTDLLSSSERLDFETTLGSLRSATGPEAEERRAQLASELTVGIPTITSIDESDRSLQQWAEQSLGTTSTRAQPSEQIHKIAFSMFKDSKNSQPDGPLGEASIATAYLLCIQTWLRPLPADAPNTCRLAKERASRFIATALALSSLRLERDSKDTADERAPSQQKSQKSAVPVIAPPSSPPLALSSRSSHTVADEGTSLAAQGPAIQAANRLSKYARIQAPVAINPAVDSIQSTLLQSWVVGSEVDATTLEFDPENQDGMGLSAEVRAREMRRLEKRKQIEARRASALKRQKQGQNEVPGFGVGIASSPGRASARWTAGNAAAAENSAPSGMAAQIDSSQSQVGQQSSAPLFASQSEPGRHGGRSIGLPVRKAPRRPGF